jgi:hypothetical protein
MPMASTIRFELQDRCLRLVFPDQVWNTPAPPSLSLCTAYPADDVSCQNLYAVETDEIEGLTFFFSYGRLFGLHVHQLSESCLWALKLGLSPTDEGDALSGFTYLFQSEITPFFQGPESGNNPGPNSSWLGPSLLAMLLLGCNAKALLGILPSAPPLL